MYFSEKDIESRRIDAGKNSTTKGLLFVKSDLPGLGVALILLMGEYYFNSRRKTQRNPTNSKDNDEI